MPVLVDWIDPGNSGGSVLIPESGPWYPKTTFYRCPYCDERRASEQSLQDHVATAHPLERPSLLLRGVAAPSRIYLRRRVGPEDFQVLHSGPALIAINGRAPIAVSSQKLPAFLAKQDDCEIHVDLGGAGRSATLHASYDVHISVPRHADLLEAEHAFVAEMAKEDVTLRDVDRFARSCQALTSCNDYVSGLADYVLGTLIKDRAGNVSLHFKEYFDKYQSALILLSGYDRMLARMLSSYIRLSINDFFTTTTLCGVRSVDAAMVFFQQTLGLPVPTVLEIPGKDATKVCPIDQVGSTIVAAVATLSRTNDLGHLRKDLTDVVHREMVSAVDRAKAYFLLAESFRRSGRTDDAAKAARYVTNDPVFGAWATQLDPS